MHQMPVVIEEQGEEYLFKKIAGREACVHPLIIYLQKLLTYIACVHIVVRLDDSTTRNP